jgi:hypothetical protein
VPYNVAPNYSLLCSLSGRKQLIGI